MPAVHSNSKSLVGCRAVAGIHFLYRNPKTSESNENTCSLVHVPRSNTWDKWRAYLREFAPKLFQ